MEQARKKLEEIRDAESKPAWEQIAGAAFGAAGFCAVFGGGFMDCLADFAIGAMLYVFCLFFSERYMSKIVGGICNALLATLLCIAFYRIGFGDSLSNIIIGAIMPLIPGVPFVNGVRDLMNSDYIAGLTRLTDAMLGFFCIAIGVSIAFMLDGWIAGGIIDLGGMTINPETAGLGWQTLAAFIGTFAFAILFGAPRKQYTAAGLIGALGWEAFLIMVRTDLASTFAAIILATALICIFSRIAAVLDRCPSTVFLLCGIFPLVPGAKRLLVHLLHGVKPVQPLLHDRFQCPQGSHRHSSRYRLRYGAAAASFLRLQAIQEKLVLQFFDFPVSFFQESRPLLLVDFNATLWNIEGFELF